MPTPNTGFAVVGRTVKPIFQEDTYPVAVDTDLQGAMRQVEDLTALEAIPQERRKYGMQVFVQSNATWYELEADLITWGEPTQGINPDNLPYTYDPAAVAPNNSTKVSVAAVLRRQLWLDDFFENGDASYTTAAKKIFANYGYNVDLRMSRKSKLDSLGGIWRFGLDPDSPVDQPYCLGGFNGGVRLIGPGSNMCNVDIDPALVSVSGFTSLFKPGPTGSNSSFQGFSVNGNCPVPGIYNPNLRNPIFDGRSWTGGLIEDVIADLCESDGLYLGKATASAVPTNSTSGFNLPIVTGTANLNVASIANMSAGSPPIIQGTNLKFTGLGGEVFSANVIGFTGGLGITIQVTGITTGTPGNLVAAGATINFDYYLNPWSDIITRDFSVIRCNRDGIGLQAQGNTFRAYNFKCTLPQGLSVDCEVSTGTGLTTDMTLYSPVCYGRPDSSATPNPASGAVGVSSQAGVQFTIIDGKLFGPLLISNSQKFKMIGGSITCSGLCAIPAVQLQGPCTDTYFDEVDLAHSGAGPGGFVDGVLSMVQNLSGRPLRARFTGGSITSTSTGRACIVVDSMDGRCVIDTTAVGNGTAPVTILKTSSGNISDLTHAVRAFNGNPYGVQINPNVLYAMRINWKGSVFQDTQGSPTMTYAVSVASSVAQVLDVTKLVEDIVVRGAVKPFRLVQHEPIRVVGAYVETPVARSLSGAQETFTPPFWISYDQDPNTHITGWNGCLITRRDNGSVYKSAGLGTAWTELGAAAGGPTHLDTVDPTVNDDSSLGYLPLTLWENSTTEQTFIMSANAVGAAVWLPLNDGVRTITRVGNYIGTPLIGSTQNGAITENDLLLTPVYFRQKNTFDRFGFNVAVAAGDATCQTRCGVYAYNGGAPTGAALIADYATVTIANTTGDKTIVISQVLDPGWYWLATITNRNGGAGAMPSFVCLGSAVSSSLIGNSTANASSGNTYRNSQVIASWAAYTLPANLPTMTMVNSATPAAMMRKA